MMTTAQPPGPGFPWHAPSVYTSTRAGVTSAASSPGAGRAAPAARRWSAARAASGRCRPSWRPQVYTRPGSPVEGACEGDWRAPANWVRRTVSTPPGGDDEGLPPVLYRREVGGAGQVA